MNKLGIAWFDDPSSPSSGWLCGSDGEVERFETHGKLRSDTTWVTNLSFFDYKEAGFIGVPNYRSSNYFNVSLDKILNDLHIHDDLPAAKFLPAVFDILSSTLKKCESVVPSGLDGYKYFKGLSHSCIPRAFKRSAQGSKGESSHFFDEMFVSATQLNQGITGSKIPAGSKAFRFHFPKATYYKWLLQQPLPAVNYWKESKLPSPLIVGTNGIRNVPTHSEGIKKLNYYLKKGKSGFCKVVIYDADPSISQFYKFGHEGFSRELREWATIEEVLEISHFSTVEISRVYITDSAPLQLPVELDPTTEQSLSEGYYRENLYKAIADHPNNSKSAIGAYLSSLDRAACGRAAIAFANDGFQIASFGAGFVTLYLRGSEQNPTECKDAINLGVSLGLIPPAKASYIANDAPDVVTDIRYQPYKSQFPQLIEWLSQSYILKLHKSSHPSEIHEHLSWLEQASREKDAGSRRQALTNIQTTLSLQEA